MPPTSSSLVRHYEIERVEGGAWRRVPDTVAAEEPLQVRVQYWFKGVLKTAPLAVTMRTPGHDAEFAAGLLLSEGVIERRQDIVEIRSLGIAPSNEILVTVSDRVDVDAWVLSRNGPLNASCGICGKRTIESIAINVSRTAVQEAPNLTPELITAMPHVLRSRQEGFGQTGGLHAAALFDAAGNLQSVFEDIGRHNALDKLIGCELLNGRTPLNNRVLFLSSRSSFELVQKAMAAGAPVLATVGGPSSLAIETARAYGLTLIGFVRGERFNVYAGEWRLRSE
jgi:FdhD protein